MSIRRPALVNCFRALAPRVFSIRTYETADLSVAAPLEPQLPALRPTIIFPSGLVIGVGSGTEIGAGNVIVTGTAQALPSTAVRTPYSTVLPAAAGGVVLVPLTIEYWSAWPGTFCTN